MGRKKIKVMRLLWYLLYLSSALLFIFKTNSDWFQVLLLIVMIYSLNMDWFLERALKNYKKEDEEEIEFIPIKRRGEE